MKLPCGLKECKLAIRDCVGCPYLRGTVWESKKIQSLKKEYEEIKYRASGLIKEDSNLSDLFSELVGIVERGNDELKRILQS